MPQWTHIFIRLTRAKLSIRLPLLKQYLIVLTEFLAHIKKTSCKRGLFYLPQWTHIFIRLTRAKLSIRLPLLKRYLIVLTEFLTHIKKTSCERGLFYLPQWTHILKQYFPLALLSNLFCEAFL